MKLNVYSGGTLVGYLSMAPGEPFYGFVYDAGYLSSNVAVPLSLSLPLQKERFTGAQALPFFEGLLPEGDVRESVARQLGISSTSPAKLLRALGKDCAGDISVLEEDDPYQPPAEADYMLLPGGLEGLAENPVAEIADLRADNRLSLAGGQEKIALYHDEREPIGKGWYVPLHGSPSTHIIKPQLSSQYPGLALNEYLCLRLAGAAGMSVAECDYLPLEVPLLVVKRFDRQASGRFSDGGLAVMRRVRQEDACQALGYPSSLKYQEDGGPGIRQVNELLLMHSEDYLADRDALARLVVFNYLIGNCDAHAKNFSFLLKRGGMRLAPAYDLVSTSVYGGGFGAPLSRTMGMRMGQHSNLDKAAAADFTLLAEDLGMSQSLLARCSNEVLASVSEALRAFRMQGGSESHALLDRICTNAENRISVVEAFIERS